MFSISERLSQATDYFEWWTHQFFAGLGSVFSGIASLLIPSRLIDQVRKKLVRRAEDRAEALETRGAARFLETCEYHFYRLTSGVYSLFRGLYQLFVPAKLIESTERAVADKTADAIWDIRYRLSKIGERFAPRWLTRPVGRLYDGTAVVLTFAHAWIISRDFGKLSWSIPALLMVTPLMASLVYSAVYTRDDRVQHYQQALSKAIEQEDAESEQLCFDKLAQLGFQRIERAEFELALSKSAQEGSWDEAVARMRSIAPLDQAGDAERPGFAPAHYWLAFQLAQNKIHVDAGSDRRWQLVAAHAQRALELSSGADGDLRASARLLLVEDGIRHGRLDAAVEEMKDLVDVFPLLHIDLMDGYLAEQDLAAAKRHARQIDVTLTRIEKAVVDNEAEKSLVAASTQLDAQAITPSLYVRWATANGLLGERQRAVQIMFRARERYPRDESLEAVSSQMLARWLADVSPSDIASWPLLRQALKLNPNDAVIQQFLVRSILESGEASQQLCDKLRAEGLLLAEPFILAGDTKWRESDYPAAVEHYRTACQIDPGAARAWNNLAWTMGNIDSMLNLEEALRAANRAIEAEPNARFIETRGQVYAKLRRWHEAIEDLERALNGVLPDSTAAHRSLARAYTEIGKPEQAAAHRKLAEKSIQVGQHPSS